MLDKKFTGCILYLSFEVGRFRRNPHDWGHPLAAWPHTGQPQLRDEFSVLFNFKQETSAMFYDALGSPIQATSHVVKQINIIGLAIGGGAILAL